MEYFPLSLSSVIKHQREQTKKPLSPAAVRTYALEVAKGMHYMHSLAPPILHRYHKKKTLLLLAHGLTEIADSVVPPSQRQQEQERVGCFGRAREPQEGQALRLVRLPPPPNDRPWVQSVIEHY